MRMIFLVLVAGLALGGCAGRDAGMKWPTLAPRAGEMSPLVPRTPLGACPGCGQDVVAVPEVAVVAALPAVGSDVAGRINVIDEVLNDIRDAYLAQAPKTEAAVRAAVGGNADAASEAEVQRSRLESVFLPLAVQSRALDLVEDDLAGRADTEALMARVALLRESIGNLQVVRNGI